MQRTLFGVRLMLFLNALVADNTVTLLFHAGCYAGKDS